MAKILSYLLLLTASLTISNVQAQSNYCYCTTNSTYNQQYGGYTCIANAECWACASGAYNPTWQQAFCPNYQAPTCTYSAVTETRSCPVNYSGSQTWKSEINCPNGQYGQPMPSGWFKIADTCTPNPPSCRTSTETQTLSCQTGYTGAILQTRSSTCSDPYGQPSWGSWVTSSDTCVKSVTNVTNVMSPISPISPTNPTSVVNQSISTPALTTPSAPVTVQAQPNVPTATTTPTQTDTKPEVKTEVKTETKTEAKTETKPTGNTANSNKNTVQTVVGNLIKFEIISQPSVKQYDLFPIIEIGQSIPDSIRRNQDLYFQFIQGETVDFGGEQDMRMNAIKQFTLEYENGFE